MVRDGWMFVLPLFGICVFFILLNRWTSSSLWLAPAGVSGVLTLFIAFFFRDPARVIPQGDGLILSAADGKVVAIREVDHQEFIEGRAIQISVFLSVLNVHVNRIPLSGVVKYRQFHRGEFLLAFDETASERNERLSLGIETEKGRIVVRQIVGFLARRIVCYLNEEDRVTSGQKYGLIRFGSRVDVVVPSGTAIRVSVGDRVRGGETILGVFI